MTLKATAVGTCAALVVFAFVAAPYSCAWGLNAYALAGLGSVVLLFALPLLFRQQTSGARRLPLSLGLATLGVGVWTAGLFLANVRILCRLF